MHKNAHVQIGSVTGLVAFIPLPVLFLSFHKLSVHRTSLDFSPGFKDPTLSVCISSLCPCFFTHCFKTSCFLNSFKVNFFFCVNLVVSTCQLSKFCTLIYYQICLLLLYVCFCVIYIPGVIQLLSPRIYKVRNMIPNPGC